MPRSTNLSLPIAALVLATSALLPPCTCARDAAKAPAINFMAWGNTYANPSARVLRDAYGSTQNANRSVIGRLPGLLSGQGGDGNLQRVLQDLGRVNDKDLTINVLRESSAERIYAGETLYYPGPAQADGTRGLLRTQVRPGESMETVARRLGVPTQKLIDANDDRIGVGAQYSGNGQIYINGQEYARSGNRVLADAIGHEAGHAVDAACDDPDAPTYYGRDNEHYSGEVLAQRHASGETTYYPQTAWQEGWANYNGMLANPGAVKEYEAGNSSLFNEGATDDEDGVPVREPIDKPTYEDYHSNEDTSALALYMLNDGGTRRQQILDTFIAGNRNNPGDREMNTFFKDYVSANPNDTSRAAGALDLASQYTATPERLTEILGPGGAHYLAQRSALAQEWAARLAADPGASKIGFYQEQVAAGRFDLPAAPVQVEAPQPTGIPQELASANGAPSSAADAGVGEAPLTGDEVASDVGAGADELQPASFEPDAPAPSAPSAAPADEAGGDVFADAGDLAPDDVATESPAEAPAEEPAEAPAEEPAEEPAEAPAEAPAEEPAEEPAEAPADSDTDVAAAD